MGKLKRGPGCLVHPFPRWLVLPGDGFGGVPGAPLTLLCLQLRTDSEKRSLAESGLSWYGEGEDKAPKKLDYDSSSLKMEHGSSKWRREPSEGGEEGPKGGELKKPVSLGTPGSLKKGKTPPVAVTSPITHTAQSTLKVAGETTWAGSGFSDGERVGCIFVGLPEHIGHGTPCGCAWTWQLDMGWKGWQGRASLQAGCGSGPTLSPVWPGPWLPHGLVATH